MKMFLTGLLIAVAMALGGCSTVQGIIAGQPINLASVLEDIRATCGFIADPGPIQQLINRNSQLTSADAIAKLTCAAISAPKVTRRMMASRGKMKASGVVGGVVITGHYQ